MSKTKGKKRIHILCGFLTFAGTAVICLLFMVLSACIPQSAVKDNVTESAEYFRKTPLFEYCVGTFENFKRDNYADCISVNIAWHFEEENPFYSVMAADYAYDENLNVNDTFYKSITEGNTEKISYSRYWHGSAGVLRILLCFMNIEGVRCVAVVVGVLLHIAVVICLFRKEHKALAATYAIGFLLINGGFALSCLEYGFVFILMPVAILFLLALKGEQRNAKATCLFISIGILTAFFDFLTAETLTFTVPFAVYYVVSYKEEQKNKKADWLFLLRCGINWCVGYAGMFLLKWVLAAAVLGKEAFLDAMHMAAERVGGDVSLTGNILGEQADFAERLKGIFVRNVGCLFWGTDNMSVRNVVLISVIVAVVLGIFWYMARKEKLEYAKTGVLAVIAVIPFIRLLVLSNHSFIHYFFTYRVQMVTVMIVLYLIYETTFLSEKKIFKKR